MAADTRRRCAPGGPSWHRPPGGAAHPSATAPLLVEDTRTRPSLRLDVHAVDTTAAGDAFCGALPWPSPRARVSPARTLRRRRRPRRDRRRGRAFPAPAPGDRAPLRGTRLIPPAPRPQAHGTPYLPRPPATARTWRRTLLGAATASQPPLNTKPGPESVDYEAQVAGRGGDVERFVVGPEFTPAAPFCRPWRERSPEPAAARPGRHAPHRPRVHLARRRRGPAGLLLYWVLAWNGAAPNDYAQMAILVALAIAAQHFPLTLTPQYKIDIAIGVYFTCLLLFGPPAAMVLVGVSQVIGQLTLALRRQPRPGAPSALPRSGASAPSPASASWSSTPPA